MGSSTPCVCLQPETSIHRQWGRDSAQVAAQLRRALLTCQSTAYDDMETLHNSCGELESKLKLTLE